MCYMGDEYCFVIVIGVGGVWYFCYDWYYVGGVVDFFDLEVPCFEMLCIDVVHLLCQLFCFVVEYYWCFYVGCCESFESFG